MLQPKDIDRLNGYKDKTRICYLQETQFRRRDTYGLKVRGWKKIFHANGNQRKAGVAILISDKIDFKTKTITRDKELISRTCNYYQGRQPSRKMDKILDEALPEGAPTIRQ